MGPLLLTRYKGNNYPEFASLLPIANEVCEGYVFTPVCLSTGVGELSRPRPRGDVGGSGRDVSRPTPRGGGCPGPGGVSQHALRQTPPSAEGYCCGRYALYWNAFLFEKKNAYVIEM